MVCDFLVNYIGVLQMKQEELNKMFIAGEVAREKGLCLDNGWGSNRHGDLDSLLDLNSNTQWVRKHPNGDWEIVPPLGSDTYA